ncbi:hypothetical protein [Arthrobacter alkaliphilus]
MSSGHLGVENSPRSTVTHSYLHPERPQRRSCQRFGSGSDALCSWRRGKFLTTPEFARREEFSVSSGHLGVENSPRSTATRSHPEGPQRRSCQRFRPGSDALFSWRHGKFLTTPEFARREEFSVSPAYFGVENSPRCAAMRSYPKAKGSVPVSTRYFPRDAEFARREEFSVSPAYFGVEKRGRPLGDFPPEAVLPKGAHRDATG